MQALQYLKHTSMIEANFYRKRLMFAMIVPAKQKKNWISTFGVQYKFMQLDIMHLINHACRCTAPQIETSQHTF